MHNYYLNWLMTQYWNIEEKKSLVFLNDTIRNAAKIRYGEQFTFSSITIIISFINNSPLIKRFNTSIFKSNLLHSCYSLYNLTMAVYLVAFYSKQQIFFFYYISHNCCVFNDVSSSVIWAFVFVQFILSIATLQRQEVKMTFELQNVFNLNHYYNSWWLVKYSIYWHTKKWQHTRNNNAENIDGDFF